MNESETHAWIFLSVSDAPCSLQDIVAVADGINHAIPSQRELQTSLGWLSRRGLIRKEGKKYALTESGVALRRSASAHTMMRTWDNASAALSKMPADADPDRDVTPQDVSNAYEGYRKWFWQEHRKQKGTAAQHAG